jgi:GMP synthase-like glutamine amidotransferase
LVTAPEERLRALVVQHEEPTPAGLIVDWLVERNAQIDVWRIDVDDKEVDARAYGLIVPLGSELPAYDDAIPWLEREKRLLLEATDADVPVLGICFGGQLLARLLGGDAFRSEMPEIGWLPTSTHDPEFVSEGPWFQWHFDTFTPPPGAEVVAANAAGPQAFVVRRSLGVQFHPEVTPLIMEDWVRAYRHELNAEGVDPDGLLEETRRRAGTARADAWRLFDGFLERVGGHDGESASAIER